MNNLNLVVMGKTGAGKSTLINAVLEEDLAPTGSGQAVTRVSQRYSKHMCLPLNSTNSGGTSRMVEKDINLYDTVGLEIDSAITKKTLREIKDLIKKSQADEGENDMALVWFCVNWRSGRLESYEVELIRSLSIEHEIPFVLVLTQCFSNEMSDLEEQVKKDFPDITVVRVLAKDYKIRSGVVPAHGITKLLQQSVLDYNNSKVEILENKFNKLLDDRRQHIDEMRSAGMKCIESYSGKAMKIGFVPGACIPFVHGICITLISALNKIVGINSTKGFASDIFANAVVGLIATPFMAIPLMGAGVAYAYVSAIGETYLNTLMMVLERSTDAELKNNGLMLARIQEEIIKRKKEVESMDGYTNAQKERMSEEKFKKMIDGLDSDKLPTANIMVVGGTGVGKSTLLNAIFGAELATTGNGRPVTTHISRYESADLPIRIWDTVGLEIDSETTKDSIKSIRETISEKVASKDQFDRIHAIWYCISSGSSRYQGAELEFIKDLHSMGVPFIIVLTQCIGAEDEVDKFEAQIREVNKKSGMNDIEIIQVLARDYKLRGYPPIKAFGLDTLVDTTLKNLPNFIKGGFAAAQKVSREQKRLYCEEIIYEYVQAAKEGVWDKVPLVNVFTANRRIMNMFKKIGMVYNTVLRDESIEKIISQCSISFENTFFGLISPIDMGYGKKVAALLEKKKDEGFNVKYDSFKNSEKVARLIAFYGYIFISSIEELWEILTEEQLQNIEMATNNLIAIINKKLKERQEKQK